MSVQGEDSASLHGQDSPARSIASTSVSRLTSHSQIQRAGQYLQQRLESNENGQTRKLRGVEALVAFLDGEDSRCQSELEIGSQRADSPVRTTVAPAIQPQAGQFRADMCALSGCARNVKRGSSAWYTSSSAPPVRQRASDTSAA